MLPRHGGGGQVQATGGRGRGHADAARPCAVGAGPRSSMSPVTRVSRTPPCRASSTATPTSARRPGRGCRQRWPTWAMSRMSRHAPWPAAAARSSGCWPRPRQPLLPGRHPGRRPAGLDARLRLHAVHHARPSGEGGGVRGAAVARHGRWPAHHPAPGPAGLRGAAPCSALPLRAHRLRRRGARLQRGQRRQPVGRAWRPSTTCWHSATDASASSPARSMWARAHERLAGYREALMTAGLPIADELRGPGRLPGAAWLRGDPRAAGPAGPADRHLRVQRCGRLWCPAGRPRVRACGCPRTCPWWVSTTSPRRPMRRRH